MFPELLITLMLCHMSLATDDITEVFRDTLTTKPLDSFWRSTGFTPPFSEPEESAEFLLSRGLLGPLSNKMAIISVV